MWKWLIGAAITIIVLVAAFTYTQWTTRTPITGQLSAVAAASGNDDPRWQRVTAPRPFSFPADHGAHPEYQTEWWYYTGNLQAEDGRAFGFQLTFFRRGLDPEPVERQSRWAARNIYLAHFTVSDIQDRQFYAAERFSRDGADLAGASGDPYHVWLGPWQATGSGPEGMTMRLQASTDEIGLDLQLDSAKTPALQGDRGYSPKGEAVGNASYYYSLTRMQTTGTLTVQGQTYRITDGLSWMDHEWGTSKLEGEASGWDWFALQLSDGRELTWAQLRRADGSVTDASFGSLHDENGTTIPLDAADLQLEALDHWTSPRSNARYPSRWRLRVPSLGLELEITPRLADQELPVSIVYWEGAVTAKGQTRTANGPTTPVTGQGYVELTGYAEATGGASIR